MSYSMLTEYLGDMIINRSKFTKYNVNLKFI